MKVLLFSKRVYYQFLSFFPLSFHNTSAWFLVAEIHNNSFFFTYMALFSSFLFFRYFLRSLDLVIISLESSFLKNGIRFPQAYFFLRRACLFKTLTLSSQNLFNPSSFITNFSLDNLPIRSFLNVSFEKCL